VPPQDDFFDIAKASVRRSMVLFASGALIGLAIAGYGLFTAKGTRSHGVPAEAVALVNQRPILRSDFMTQSQTQFEVPFEQTTHAQRMQTLEAMIDEELMVQRGLEIDLPSYDPDVRTALVAGVELEVTADVLAQQPTPEELRRYYERHKDRYSSEGVMQLRDLVAATQAKAAAAVEDLRHGRSLEAVVTQFGLVDSGRLMDAGRVDTADIFQFAVRAKLDDALYEAASSLPAGAVSSPVTQSDGVHLIVMIKHSFPVPQSFEQAGNRVWTDLNKDAQTQVRAANLAYLRSRADILVAPEYRH
jgi:parvulin-like peptidyl-prolyl isomerase